MQLGKEILYPLKHTLQLAQEMLLLAPRCLGWAPHRFLARTGSLLLLPLDEPPPLLFFLHYALQAGLHLPGQVQHMPHIPLVRAECFGGAQGVGNGPTSITDRTRAGYSLFVQIP